MNRALLIGINNYPSQPLKGCVNDVDDMSKFLVEVCGFARNDIRLLVNERATKSAILERLGWLLTGVKANDRILFFFSGHGVQLPTRNPQGEVDGLDEVICPYDFNWTETTSIRDKEFATIFSTVPPGTLFTWIADCCHSDDLTKGLRNPANTSISKSMDLPLDIAWRIEVAREKKIKSMGFKSAADGNVLLLSGCEANQESVDDFINNKFNGVLTYHLIKYLHNGGLKQPMQQVVQDVKAMIKPTYSQNPQISGSTFLASRPFLS